MDVTKTTYSTIARLRTEFLRENNIQFVLDKCYRYDWADAYAFRIDGRLVGYGAVWGKEKREDRDAIFEFYLEEDDRALAEPFFRAFCHASQASYVECQSNDRSLYPMFERFTENVETDAILFADHHETHFQIENTALLPRQQPNPDDCHYVLASQGEEIGEGGFMLNYNFPYADIYYNIHEAHRRKGFGSFFVQELKKEIYALGRVPAARCNTSNVISKATLSKAGMVVCGLRLSADLRRQPEE
ncbi:GNAT family N-acetyltransferase [Dawidia soli]|uniref:GNAT family N-acetyltransferase n=1 Tax=Dawidia soli TaxID=2782352 RepID=A0AAP2GHW4_9BACT|nr:GNAT family N-acetyltransferase [Dawidia soli]MBT1686840.1 GNAT family N-acetyltransferase [Dawidia soli]